MLKKTQLKNKWDKLRADLSAWKKLMRKQTGTGWNWDKGTINMDPEWWKKNQTSEHFCHGILFICRFY